MLNAHMALAYVEMAIKQEYADEGAIEKIVNKF